MNSEDEIREKIEGLKKRYVHYRRYITKHKKLGDRKTMVETYSNRCPRIISSINALRWVINEQRVRDNEVNGWV